MAMVRGIDVSAFQKTISWKAIKDAGLEFGFIKATEGTFYTNKHYERQRKSARRQGIPVGAYHFAHPDFDDGPDDEAEHFLEVAQPQRGDLLPVLDLERARQLPDGDRPVGEPLAAPGREEHRSAADPLHVLRLRGEPGRPRATAHPLSALACQLRQERRHGPPGLARRRRGRPSRCTSTRRRTDRRLRGSARPQPDDEG